MYLLFELSSLKKPPPEAVYKAKEAKAPHLLMTVIMAVSVPLNTKLDPLVMAHTGRGQLLGDEESIFGGGGH